MIIIINVYLALGRHIYTDTLAESYLLATSSSAGAAAVGRKELKYQSLATTDTFILLAFKTLSPVTSKSVVIFLEARPGANKKPLFCFNACHNNSVF